jgi:sporulation protein YlmC with PRC-barrel domain
MMGADINGKEVVGKNGFKIGKSKDIIIDRDSWKVSHIDIQLNDNIEAELGMPSSILSHNHLPLDVSNVEGVADVITLNTTKEELIRDLNAMRNPAVTTSEVFTSRQRDTHG